MNTIELVEALRGRNFYLGGSRRMAEKYPDKIAPLMKPNADWDFCCIDSKENRDAIERLGFICQHRNGSSYWDDLLVDIYKHPEMPVDVLIRHDVKIYADAFESLSPEVFIDRIWKSSPTRNPKEPTSYFRERVSTYFNALFRLHGYQDRSPW
jgi:hypothetical protein